MLKNLVVPCEINPLPAHEVEIDEFGVRYTANERPNIQNDTITLNYRTSGAKLCCSLFPPITPCPRIKLHSTEKHVSLCPYWGYVARIAAFDECCVHSAGDHKIKLSISHALSQSTKLCVFEERVLEIVASTKDLPESLATTGGCGVTDSFACAVTSYVMLAV